jgi:hypothetical protein
MGKVISLREKTETWIQGYVSPDNSLHVMVSNHGRFKFHHGPNSRPIFLDFVDSVSMLSQLSSKIEEALDILYEK